MALETSKNSRNLKAILGAVLVAGGLLAFKMLSPAGAPAATGPGGTTTGATQNVLVALTDIPQSSTITAANVALKPEPVAAIPNGAITDSTKALNQYAVIKIGAGQVLTPDMLISSTDTTSGATSLTKPPLAIADGKVAISIPFDENLGAGGYIQPTEHVDILVGSATVGVSYSFQDIKVLKVGGTADGATPKLLVLEVTPKQAETLALLTSTPAGWNGYSIIKITTRPHSAYGNATYLQNATPVNPSNWVQSLNQ